MKAPSIILIIFLVSMLIILAGLQMVGERTQRANSRTLEKVIAELTERSHGLEAEVKNLRQQIATQQVEHASATRPETGAEPSSDATTNFPAAKAIQPQPFQARAYVGNDYLGMAWVIPSRVKQDTETGEYQFEPVIWIDQKARGAFTKTNIVEREVVLNEAYNESQSIPQSYWYGYPVWVRPNRFHEHPVQPPKTPPVARPTVPSGGGPWSPAISRPPLVPSPQRRPGDSTGGSSF